MSDWISVRERLPENDSDVLCWFGGTAAVCSHSMYGWEPSEVHDTSYDMAIVVLTGEPTHWMPLPTPPEDV